MMVVWSLGLPHDRRWGWAMSPPANYAFLHRLAVPKQYNLREFRTVKKHSGAPNVSGAG
jgi:hypothetical protein